MSEGFHKPYTQITKDCLLEAVNLDNEISPLVEMLLDYPVSELHFI